MITIEEESVFPWSTAPSLARRLDELARRHGVTIMGSGAHAGSMLPEFESHVAERGWPSFVVRKVIAAADTPSRSLGRVIDAGSLLGVIGTATVTSHEGPRFTFEQSGCVYGPSQSDVNEWIVRGEPEELRLRNDRAPTRLATCTQVVNRIPDVIAARPGFVTAADLPRPRYGHFPSHSYLQCE